MSFIKSISGIRATLNDGLRPEILTKYIAAYCNSLPLGAIVVGRDGRPSGKWIAELTIATISATGRQVYYLDIAPTPTVQLLTEKTDAVGGISITASHNPEMWNGLKFLNSDGVFLNQLENELFWKKYDDNEIVYSTDPANSSDVMNINAIEEHIGYITKSNLFDMPAIRNYLLSKKFKIVVDAVNASGSKYVPKLLKEFGCEVVELFTDNTGVFPHTPEPITENLNLLSQSVISNNADMGIAVDPDADRLVLLDENGDPIGEEKTIAIAVKSVLEDYEKYKSVFDKSIVVNLSTSGMIEKIANEYGAVVTRSPVGEINVVNAMKEANSVIGGEGSGGVILPHIHYGRDSLVGIALLLSLLHKYKCSLKELSDKLPLVYMEKYKVGISANPKEVLSKISEKYSDYSINNQDGIRIILNENEWVHIRASNTEPIIRIIAESNNLDRVKTIINEFNTQISEIF